MITGINDSKALTKHVSFKCKYKFDDRKCKSNEKWNNDKCRCECKKHHISERVYICNPAICSCKNGKYLASIIDNSVITCDKFINSDAEAKSYDKEIKTIPKYIICEIKVSILYLLFY